MLLCHTLVCSCSALQLSLPTQLVILDCVRYVAIEMPGRCECVGVSVYSGEEGYWQCLYFCSS